ncbi:MAG TPA: glycosyltransferase N-terminal domain-containing protein [Gemmatimonadales bacterium]|nr:glycosyltransferase N-terminal domain-containing protein [Gemmatimonadales bacterium]
MPPTSWSYRAAVRLGVALAPLIGIADRKVAEGHRRRRRAADRLAWWAASNRDHARPLVWFHAASVGEGRQAESVLDELRRLLPACQMVYTHFSPSAEPLARRLHVDVADYLPYDTPAAAHRVLEALAPDLLVFAKLDLWPELASGAEGRGTGVALVAATVSPGSGRLRWPARELLRPGYAAVRAAGAISEADADRLATLGVAPTHIRVTGDPRFDSVAARVAAVEPGDPLLAYGASGPTLVAGSTWPADNQVVLGAFAGILERHPAARLIVVPHEPTADHLTALERRAAALRLPPPVRLSAAQGAVPLLLVDRVGALATLYGAGTMAYVGGGFGRAGLHSVLEPAAWGVPVCFGPRWQDSRDAALLLEGGAASAIPADGTGGVTAMVEIWEKWLTDEAYRRTQGARAATIVAEGRGAARRSAEMLAELISSRPPRRSPSAAPAAPPSAR